MKNIEIKWLDLIDQITEENAISPPDVQLYKKEVN